MANRYWVGGNANWDATAGTKWALTSGGAGGQAVPTSSDDVFLDNGAGTGNVAIAAAASCNNFDCTGYTRVLSGTSALSCFGTTFKLVAGMTVTHTGQIRFRSTSGTTIITSGGTIIGPVKFEGVGGTFQLADAMDTSGNTDGDGYSFVLVAGTCDTNGQSVATTVVGLYDILLDGPSQLARTVTLGASTFTLNSGLWDVSIPDNLTLAPGTSTIKFIGTANAEFYGGGVTYSNIWNAAIGGGQLLIRQGNNTFDDVKISAGAIQQFESGTTTTLSSLTTPDTGRCTITSNDAGTHTLSKASGTIAAKYCTISKSVATGGATWNAFLDSWNINGGSNTGWVFSSIAAAETLRTVQSNLRW